MFILTATMTGFLTIEMEAARRETGHVLPVQLPAVMITA
jgi:hypothetical protein